ncbi:MAG: hypothetical protein ACYCYM_01515 [Saccharofermentanales bacterium]
MLQKLKTSKTLALFLAIALVVSSVCIGIIAGSEEVNLLANLSLSITPDGYTVDAATNSLTVATTAEHQVFFNSLTLDPAKTYSYEFTMNFDNVAASESVRIPVRFAGDFSNGHFAYLGLNTFQQLRVNTDYWTNAANLAVKVNMGYQSGVDYAYKIITAPTSMQIYIDGVLQVENTNLPAIGGQIGIASNNATFKMKNISLKEVVDHTPDVIQKINDIGTIGANSKASIRSAREAYEALTSAQQANVTNYAVLTAAEAAFDSLNLMADLTLSATPAGYTVDAATNSLTVATAAEHQVYFNGLNLDAAKTYNYEFTLNFDSITGESIRIPVRFAGDYSNGHWVYINFANDQLRVNTDYWSNAGNLAVKGSMGYAAGVDYDFKIVTTPTTMQIYIDGVLQVENTILPAIGGQIGIASNNATFRMKDISLTDVSAAADNSAAEAVIAQITGIGTVNATSKAAIRGAREAYEALTVAQQANVTNYAALTAAETAFTNLNLMAGLTLGTTPAGYTVDAATNSLTVATAAEYLVYFNGLNLDAAKTYNYEFTLNFDNLTGESIRIPVRFAGDYSNGHWVYISFPNDQLRVNTDYWSNAGNLAVKGGMGYAAGVDYDFKIVTTPTTMQIYVDGVLQVESTVLPAIGGQIGIASNNATFKMKDISLTEIITIVYDPEVDAVIQKITDIGTVDASSKALIRTARRAYDALAPAQQVDITNYAVLTAAEATFNGLNMMLNLTLSTTPAGYTVDAATNSLTVATAAEYLVYFNGLNLDAAKTYNYEFTLNFDNLTGESIRIPVRFAGDYGDGHWVYISFPNDQLRINTDYWSNDSNLAVKGGMGYAAGVDYDFKIVTTPTTMQIYVGGILQVESTVLPAIGGQIGIASNNATFKMKDISLTEVSTAVDTSEVDAVILKITGIGTVGATSKAAIRTARYAYDALTAEQQADVTNYATLTAAEASFASLNLMANLALSITPDGYAVDAATNSLTVTTRAEHQVYFNSLTLDTTKEYCYEFILNLDDVSSSSESIRIPVRFAGDYNNGHFAYLNYSLDQLRVNQDYWTNGGSLAVKTNMGYQAGVDYAYKIITTATTMKIYVDGILQVENLSLPSTGGQIGIASNNATFKMKDISLTLVGTTGGGDPDPVTETATHDIDFYSLSATDKMGYNYWPSMLMVTNTSGGGMHAKWINTGTNVRVGVDRGVALDGLHAVFSKLSFDSASKKLAFFLADRDPVEEYTQFNKDIGYMPLTIVLDADAGTASVMYYDEGGIKEDIIITNDALKSAQLENTEWSMRIDAAGNGDYTLEVAGCTGVITQAMISRQTKLTNMDSVYFTLSPWGAGVSAELDFLSLHGGADGCADLLTDEEVAAVKSVTALISSIGTVTKDSGTLITDAETAYNALTANQKAVVSNYATLRIARAKYDNLTIVNIFKDPTYYSPSTDDLMGANHWTDNLFMSDIATGGIHYEWFNAGTDYRTGVNKPMALDGLHLVFSGLNFTSDKKAFALYLADLFDFDWNEKYAQISNGDPLAVIFNTDAGTLSIGDGGNKAGTIILQSDFLLYENLKDVAWDLKITAKGNGDYLIKVAGQEATLTADMIAAAGNLTELDEVYLTLTAWSTSPNISMTLDLLSLHGGEVVCADEISDTQIAALQTVIDKINDVYTDDWQIVPASGDRLAEAFDAYNNLEASIKALVSNLNDLYVADEVYNVVSEIDSLGTITLESADEIASIREMYKALYKSFKGTYKDIDVSYYPLVGNYDKLNDAIFQLYNLQKVKAIALLENGGTDSNPDSNPDVQTGVPGIMDMWYFPAILLSALLICLAYIEWLKHERKESKQ